MLINIASLFIILITTVATLIYGKSLLVPFIFALLLWFIIRKLTSILNKVSFIRTSLPSWFKNLIATSFVIIILSGVSKILLSSISALSKSYEKYKLNIDLILNKANQVSGINLDELTKQYSGSFDFSLLFSSVFNSLTDILSNAFIILFYTLFIFVEEIYFPTKLKVLFSENSSFVFVTDILKKIDYSISRYLGLKTFVSFITGILSYTALFFIGIESPEFWAFLIFLLNFIPTIGSLIATLFPALFSVFQFGGFLEPLLVLVFVGFIQILVGNILEPKLMGNSLNISSLVAIVSLSFWGVIWGVTGMIISIPITVIMIILFSQFNSTKPISILLSEKGEIVKDT